MKTRDDYSSSMSDEITKQEYESFGTKSYRPEKIYESRKATEEDKQHDKDIIISGALYFNSKRQMYYYRRGNGNLMADGTIDGCPTNQEEQPNSQENRYFCRIF
jgi:hypothetical protein